MALLGGGKLEAYLSTMGARVSNASSVEVGFLPDATYPDGTPVAMVAAIQDGGAPSRGIPPRPFFRNMVADKSAGWGEALETNLKGSGYDAEKALALMGEGISGQLRESIVGGDYAPNSPVTNLLKQRFPAGGQTFADVLQARADVAAGQTAPAGKPLVQSGDLLAAVDYRVIDADGEAVGRGS